MTVATTTEATATVSHNLSQSAGRLDPEAAGTFVGKLFAEHGRMVLGLSRLLLGDPVEAEDAAQQVFLSAQEAVLRGSLPRDPRPWLAAITRNECRARVRERMREPLALPELPSDLPDPLAAAVRAADLQAIWVALGTLPRRQRRALVLREVGGLSYRELGRALGVSHSAVESLLFRARQQVRTVVAGANARLAALPVALKAAGALLSVSVVATGASNLQPLRIPVVAAQPRGVKQPVAPPAPLFRLKPLGVVRAVPARAGRAVAPRRRLEIGHEVEHEPGRHRGVGKTNTTTEPIVEPVEETVGQTSEGPGAAPAAPAQLEVRHDGPGESTTVPETGVDGDHDSDGSSHADGGSGHSGPG